MIQYLLSTLIHSVIEIRIVWLLMIFFITFQLGYYYAKRKYQKTLAECSSSQCISPYSQQEEKESIHHSLKKESAKRQPQHPSQPEIHQVVQTHSKSTQNTEYFPTQLLKEKIEFQMKKIHSTSFLQIRVQSSKNTKFMRKIEKHQLVTDYQLQVDQIQQTQLVPFKQNPAAKLAEPHSLVQVVAHQDHNLTSPIFQKRFINTTHANGQWKEQEVTSWLTETGRFNKFFRKPAVIGKGGFGCVFKALSIFDQNHYAVKKIIINGTVKLSELLSEVTIISKNSHPNIVLYHTCWIELANLDQISQLSQLLPHKTIAQSSAHEISANYVSSNSGFTFNDSPNKSNGNSSPKIINSPPKASKNQLAIPKPSKSSFKQAPIDLIHIYTLHIQMELCHSSLYDYLKNRQTINNRESFEIVSQIIAGLHFLHSNGIVHRDLKPGNILLCKEGKLIKIGDFGLATLIEASNDKITRQKVGTPHYMAPQLNSNQPIPKDRMYLVDIFSLGVIYYELLTMLNQCTHHQRHQKLNNLQSNNVHLPSKELKEEKKLINLLTRPAHLRPTIFQIINSNQYLALKNKYKH